jgi:hypothetical protein
MIATHSVNINGEDHFFCEHHKLSDLKPVSNFKKLLPLFFVFAFITLASLTRQVLYGYDPVLLMMDFMGVFFIVFGAFKLYDLKGFVEGFKTYDMIAKRFTTYGYLFPFIELALGALYLLGYMFLLQNIIVFIISALGLYSAYEVIRSKKEIKCVCLGTFFTLPMTWATFSENLVMFVMVTLVILSM